nr:hypothetical protein [Actinomycetota bacterium]
HLHLGEVTRAEDLAELASEHTRHLGISHELAQCQDFRAHLALLDGKHQRAHDLLTEAAELAEGHHVAETDTRNSTATLHRLQRRLPQAAALHNQALKAAERSRYRRGQVMALLGLSAVCRDQGKLDQATNHANAALEWARHTGLRTHEAQALTARAEACLDHRAVVNDASRAQSIHAETGHRLFEAQTLYLLAKAATRSANDTEARHHLRKANTLLSAMGIAVVPEP